MTHRTNPEEIGERLGLGELPQSWRRHWDESAAWMETGECRESCLDMPGNAPELFGLPEGVIEPLARFFEAVRRDDDLADLMALWHFLIFHLPDPPEDNPSAWPLPHEQLGDMATLFPIAVLASGADDALNAFRRLGVSEDIARDTLVYSGYFVRDYRRKHGVWGLAHLGWMRNYVRAKLFRLGRLSFMAAVYAWPLRAFRHRQTGEIITLCEPTAHYRRDGLADGTNGISDPEAWTPSLEMTERAVTGFPVSKEGIALRKTLTLGLDEWEQALAPGDDVIEIHIAAESGRMPPEECADSYRRALAFFAGYYPGTRFAAFTCWSWLLDPNLLRILPPDSNIIRFQRPFHVLPVVGNERQAYDLVFGNSDIDLAHAPRETSLQRAIIQYVEAGNRMRSAAGFMTWDEVAAQSLSRAR